MSNLFNLTSESGNPLEFVKSLPRNYNGPVIVGAAYYTSKSNLSELVLQELRGEEYSIRLILGKFLKRLYAKGWINTEGLYSSLMFKNDARKKIISLGETHLREGQYNCYYTKPSECSSFFKEGKEFRMMDIFYSPILLGELIPFFPALKSIINADRGTFITEKPFWLPVTIKELINQILSCPYDEKTRQFYFDLKVREVLYHMLENAYRKDISKLSFTPWEINRIHEAKNILLNHISSKPPSVRKLSRLVALNEYKLKKGFRQYFNSSIGKWMQEQKFQYSRELILNTNKPIKEICTMAGYPLTTNFITAFRRRFGVTPGDLRRK
ncbi:hypothetical protein DC498_10935 [Terrimonas sp.]|uniref:helix-turn-helix transcriptional regulator n=1 Tax=Terrimonas sp. TaxID=1914338 RepID=UPI000D5230E6|nr:AraC family transcriptional regulator [Terrimonas sp.]PVD52230.1 hypothetical protein DC498_10935 [Terrimonas sp.]